MHLLAPSGRQRIAELRIPVVCEAANTPDLSVAGYASKRFRAGIRIHPEYLGQLVVPHGAVIRQFDEDAHARDRKVFQRDVAKTCAAGHGFRLPSSLAHRYYCLLSRIEERAPILATALAYFLFRPSPPIFLAEEQRREHPRGSCAHSIPDDHP